MELVDIGVNLTHESFRHDRDAVIDAAIDAGVVNMVVTGASEQASRDAQAIAATRPGVLYATAGVHPHHASEYTTATGDLIHELAEHDNVVAVGECGLDYNRNYSPHPSQKDVFEAQLQIAAELNMPVFMHLRDAFEDFVMILDRYRDRLPAAVAHCFTGTEQELDELLARDLYIGVTGWICDERRGEHLKEFIHKIPSDRLMLETDAPYLLPRDLRPKPKDRRNLPAYLPHVLHTVAGVLGRAPQQVAAETTRSARTFFGIDAAGVDQ